MTISERTFRAPDGTALLARRANPEGDVAGIVTICHGLGEHSGRYRHVWEHLTAAGWAVYLIDLRGHGRSEGLRGHVDRWHDYVGDLLSLRTWVAEDGRHALPWVLLGHSMGGLVAVHAALERQEKLAGLVLSGPLLGVAVEVPGWKAALGRLLSNLLPRLRMANEIDSSLLSHDPEVVAAYDADPLVHHKVSTRWFTEMTAALAEAQRRAPELHVPLLLLHGSADALTDVEAAKRFAAHYGGPAEIHILEGFYHEVFNEIERERPLRLLEAWLTRLVEGPVKDRTGGDAP